MNVYIDVDIRLESPGRNPNVEKVFFDERQFNRSISYWEVNEITEIEYFKIPWFIDKFREWVKINCFKNDSITTQIRSFWKLHSQDWECCSFC